MNPFREQRGSTFADTWFRVRDSRPRLSPQARIVRQAFGRDVRYIVEEPSGGRFYRLSESAYFFGGLLDGRRTVDEAWEACNAQLGDHAPTQQECIEFLTNMQMYGLLMGDQPLAPDMLAAKRDQLKRTRVKTRTGNWMFFTIPLINPQPALERLTDVCKLVFSRFGFLVWLALGLTALGMIATRWDDLGSSFNNILNEHNLVWLGLVFLLIRVVHEAGHAMACRAVGARCYEMGVMLIAYVLPLPYCDATDSWRLPRVRDRVLVAAAGVMVETAFASLAVFVWVGTSPGLLNSLAFNLMVLSGISSMLFNMNPLLRYDGYYILTDLLGSANLAQRAKELWVFMTERFAFGVVSAKPPAIRDRTEAWILGVYQLLAFPYRLTILAGILLLVAQKYITIGLVLAVFFAGVWVVWPLAKGVWYLLTNDKLSVRRARAIGVTLAAFVPLFVLLGWLPAPAAGYAPGVVRAANERTLRAVEDGFIRQVSALRGDKVEAGEVVVELENPRLEHALAIARARVLRAEANLDRAYAESPTEVPVARARLRYARRNLEEQERMREQLRLVSPVSGRITRGPLEDLDLDGAEGMFVRSGDALAVIADVNRLEIHAEVSDAETAYITRWGLPSDDGKDWAEFRASGSADKVRRATIDRRIEQGTRTYEQIGITSEAGGDITLDPTDRNRTLEPQFTIILSTDHTRGLRPGQRVRVRFPTVPEPLLSQWYRAARRYVDARLPG